MKAGYKYFPLYQFLKAGGQDRVSLTFGEIEALLGKPLPSSARARHDWWGNRRKATQAAAWMEAGYRVLEVQLQEQRITFGRPVKIYQIRRTGDSVAWDKELIKALRYHLGLSQAELAKQLGVRQQTISEWETGLYTPSRATRKYLTLVAERVGFIYGEVEETPEESTPDSS